VIILVRDEILSAKEFKRDIRGEDSGGDDGGRGLKARGHEVEGVGLGGRGLEACGSEAERLAQVLELEVYIEVCLIHPE